MATVTNDATSTEPAYQQVAATIRDMILTGELAPGERLPIESELAERFKVSRSTVREALRVISSQDLVSTTRGVNGGTFVNVPEAGNVTDALEFGLGLLASSEGVTVDELLEVREILEVPATRIAARRITPEMLRELERTLDNENGFDHHRQFHITLIKAAGNRLLEVVTTPIFEVLRTRFLRDGAAGDFWGNVGDDHAKIVAAIRANDADAAAAEMLNHLRNLRPTYVELDRERLR